MYKLWGSNDYLRFKPNICRNYICMTNFYQSRKAVVVLSQKYFYIFGSELSISIFLVQNCIFLERKIYQNFVTGIKCYTIDKPID